MLDRILDYVIQWCSGLILVVVAVAAFYVCRYLASHASEQEAARNPERTKLCWLLRSENCF